MITHIHHINFVVANLTESVNYFTQLLQQQPVLENLPQRNVNTARFSIGESFLVLVEPLSTEGVVANILASKGEGIFLLSLGTQSIDSTLADFERTHEQKRQGLANWDICDISPIEQFGAILQLTQNTPPNNSK